MKEETWRELDMMFKKHPIMKADGVPFEEIDATSAQIGFRIGMDYREFIHRYGGAIVGPLPIFGLRKAMPMGNGEESFVEVTKAFRRQKWPSVDKWAIISVDHSGNPIGLDESGQVWISDHDAGVVQAIADNFENFLRKRCLNFSY